MKGYIKFINGLPLIVKVLLALPIVDGFVYGIYRIAKGNLVSGLIWIFTGGLFAIGAFVDIITLIAHNKVELFV